jgi:5-methyltetrahydropteroyltriglutamate--homocysteine methyltransferase
MSFKKKLLKSRSFLLSLIDSYPQTAEIKKFRAAFKENSISEEEYDNFVKNEIKKLSNCRKR